MRRIGGIERYDLRMRGQRPVCRNRRVDRIGHDQRDTPTADAGSELLGKAGHAGQILPVTQLFVSAPQRDAIGCGLPAAASMCSTVGKICGIANVIGSPMWNCRGARYVGGGFLTSAWRTRLSPAASRSHVLSVTPRSRSLYFWTLPLSVLGSSSMNSR